jgi:Ca2+-binding EF-hand superfamily protein
MRNGKLQLPKISASRRKAGIANLFGSTFLQSSSPAQNDNINFLSFYENNSGTLNLVLKELLIDLTEQRAWLSIWLKIDSNRNNRMTFQEFCKFFQLNSLHDWTRRVFDLMNTKHTGVVTFDEFLSFCLKYLILDSVSVHEFTFCLLSRRAAFCDIQTTVLDLQDMKFFLKFCYKIKKQQVEKVAMEIFTEMDNSGDFGIAFSEFQTYSQRNQTFLAFGNYFLTHFRLCWFGYEFWVRRSQQVKKHQRGIGFGSFIRLKSANLESEELISALMKRYGLNPKNLRLKKKSSSVDEGNNEERALPPVVIAPVAATGKRRGSVFDRLAQLTKSKNKDIEMPKVGIGPGGVIGEEFYDEDDPHNTAASDGTKIEETDEQKAQRLNSLQFNAITFDYFR